MNTPVSATRTPVPRCSIKGKHHQQSHESGYCYQTQRERDELEQLGFYQETYRELEHRFKDWNWGVWNDRWTMLKGLPCDLCGSTGPAIKSGDPVLCFECLTEFPLTSWHPTGGVVPKLKALLTHAARCDKHSTT